MNELDQIRQNIKTLPRGLRTRFAPSPTGHLHLGHTLSAIFTWGIAEAVGAKVLLRIEDHDVGRCRQEHVESIIDDLQWLGFSNSPATEPSRLGYELQSHSFPDFALHAERLKDQSYYCHCSRKKILNTHPNAFEGGELCLSLIHI